VTISNLVKDPKLLVHGRAEGVRGGMSGLPTQKVSNDLIAKTYKKYGKKLDIIGVGGVFTAEDAYAKIRRGAKVVALVTGLIYNGPQLGAQVQRGLVKLLRRDGFRSIEEAVGADIHPTLYTSSNE
jgi:dihydroorotate dehydrogenase